MEKAADIRMAELEDVPQLLEIYAPYVINTAVSFEYTVPTQEEFEMRVAQTLRHYPYLVAQQYGKIVGYAYASPFHTRQAYHWAAETSIYVDSHHHGKGIGRLLYEKMEKILKAQHITNLYACISFPNPESIAFHSHLGYKKIGHFHSCGYKFNRWYDMVWMEKVISGHTSAMQDVIPVTQLDILALLMEPSSHS